MLGESKESAVEIWGRYPDYQAVARFEYGRRLWRDPAMRECLLSHWTDARHPYRERFLDQRALIEEVLSSTEPAEKLNRQLLERGTSLRCIAREIPPVFGGFFTGPKS